MITHPYSFSQSIYICYTTSIFLKGRIDLVKKLLKRFSFPVSLLFLLVLLSGCTQETSDKSTDDSSSVPVTKRKEEAVTSNSHLNDTDSSAIGEENLVTNDSSSNMENEESTKTSDTKDKKPLSKYSAQEIEYARVWLQLGPNQDIDELYVQKFSAGEPLNHNDETSANYPENVVHLSGSRLVDGSVTYSSNGDGSINVYKVPHRWDGKYPAGEQFYIDTFINNTELVYVGVWDDEKVVTLINKIIMQ